MSVLREAYGEKTECNFPLETVTKRRKNKGLETSPSRVKESSKGINQGKMPGEGFYLQWNSWGHVRGGKSQTGLRGGAVAHGSAQFCSQLNLLHPGDCCRRNCIAKKNHHTVYWWLLFFIMVLNELNARLGWRSCWGISAARTFQQRVRGLCHSSVLTSHFSPTESYFGVQRLVGCPHFAFYCSNKILTRLLSFQCCRSQQLGVRGAWANAVPGESEVRISVSLP